MSTRGKCVTCAEALVAVSIFQMATHDGPVFIYWRQRMAASVGGRLLDDERQTA